MKSQLTPSQTSPSHHDHGARTLCKTWIWNFNVTLLLLITSIINTIITNINSLFTQKNTGSCKIFVIFLPIITIITNIADISSSSPTRLDCANNLQLDFVVLAQIINQKNLAIQSQSTSWWSYDHLRHSLQLSFVVIVQSFHKVSIHWGASRSSILQGVVACLLFLNINVHVFMLALHVHENKHIANQKSR